MQYYLPHLIVYVSFFFFFLDIFVFDVIPRMREENSTLDALLSIEWAYWVVTVVPSLILTILVSFPVCILLLLFQR